MSVKEPSDVKKRLILGELKCPTRKLSFVMDLFLKSFIKKVHSISKVVPIFEANANKQFVKIQKL